MNWNLLFVSVLLVIFTSSDFISCRKIQKRSDDPPPAEGGAAGGAKKCIKCKNFEDCGGNRAAVMDCSAEKMSTIGLDKDEKALFDGLDAATFDDNTKYTACVTLQWDGKFEFRGCVPDKVGDNDVCKAIQEKKNVTCVSCAAADAPCNNGTSLKESSAKTDDSKSHSRKHSPELTIYFWIFSAALVKLLM